MYRRGFGGGRLDQVRACDLPQTVQVEAGPRPVAARGACKSVTHSKRYHLRDQSHVHFFCLAEGRFLPDLQN